MYVLNHNNVDNYPSVISKWKKKPTKDNLIKVLKDYFEYDDVKSNKLADDLINIGCCSVADGACNRFELQNI